MMISREKLLFEAETTGFRAELLEKAVHLLSLLQGFRDHPFLKNRLALKGGTALNLFVLDVPRLSVDIDLNYVGASEVSAMLAERVQVEDAVQAVCQRENLSVRRVPQEHAVTTWFLRYDSSIAPGGNLEIDLNFMFRTPLWPATVRDSHLLGSYAATDIPVLDVHELAAGKLTALLARHQPRDLFDVHQLLSTLDFDRERLCLAFVVYGAGNRRDWRSVRIEELDFDAAQVEKYLLPLVRRDFLKGERGADFARRLFEECRQALNVVLPLDNHQLEFLGRLLDYGEIEPSLLTKDPDLSHRIQQHPLLNWKALNVRQHRTLRDRR